MPFTTCSVSTPVTIVLLCFTVVSSYSFCSWRPQNLNTQPDAQLSFQCTDPSTPIIIIENATIGYAYNNMNGSCTTYIGCSQQVTDFAQYCTGYNTPCSLNQQTFYMPYASQTCGTAYINYVFVNYSCIAANVQPPSDICNSQQSLRSSGLIYLSTSSSFPLSNTFPTSPIQCSCSFKPMYQGVTANISIRSLIVDLEDYTSCSQKLTIRPLSKNDTVFCSRSVSTNITSYVQLELNPSISFQSSSTYGSFLLEIRTLTSSISGTIGSLACNRNNATPASSTYSTSSTKNPLTPVSVRSNTTSNPVTSVRANTTSVNNPTSTNRTVAPAVTTLNPGTTKVNQNVTVVPTDAPRTNPQTTQHPTNNCPIVTQACNFIKLNDNNAPSGEYRIGTLFGKTIQVYCEMGLNGGGYTFIRPFDWPSLSNAELQAMFQDRTTFLMRAQKSDGTQPYGILKQLTSYSSIALNLGLNTNSPYSDPVNYAAMGKPYVSFGFHPPSIPANNNIQGVQCNGVNITFANCPSISNSYVALFADFNEIPEATNSATNVEFVNQLIGNLTFNPSGRRMPAEYFTFAEFQFGEGTCAHYTTTGRLRSSVGVLSVAIGIR